MVEVHRNVQLTRCSRPNAAAALAAAFAGSVLLFGTPDAVAADEDNARQAAGGNLEEIIVTARKRSETELSVPAPMSALSRDALERQSAVQLSDFLTTTPGANFTSSRDGATMIILRGITTGDNVNPTVATYVDEAPFGSSTIFALGSILTPDIDPVDVDHVEILRGPQGTLYGANSIGGIVKYVMAAPDPTAFSGHVEAGTDWVDNGGEGWSTRGAVNIPLSSDLAVRVSGYHRAAAGYIDDPFRHLSDINGTTINGGRLSGLWQPTAPLSIRFSAMLHDVHSRDAATEDVNQFTLRPLFGDLQEHRYLPQPLDTKYRIYNVAVSYDIPAATFLLSSTYTTEHVRVADDQTPSYLPLLAPIFGPTFGATLARDISQSKWTEEARLSSSGEHALEWQLGAFFTRELSNAFDTLPTYNNATAQPVALPNLFTADLDSEYKEYSIYGDLDYHVSDAFDTLVGVRYSYDEQPYHQTADGLLYGAPVDIHARTSENATTFLFNPRYKLSGDNMVYARIASGYRPGGPNALPPAALGFPLSFGPDRLTNYELGWKAALLERRLTVDISVFHIDWDKIQLAENKGGYTAEGNGGQARSDGAEAQLILRPLPGLSLTANAAYTNARMKTTSPDVGAVEGDHLPLVPRMNWGLSGDYDWNLAGSCRAFVGATYRHVGDRPNLFTVITTGTTATPYTAPTLPHYYQLDLRTGVSVDQWTLHLFVKNATDQRGILSLSATTLDVAAPAYSAAVTMPRTIGLNLSTRF